MTRNDHSDHSGRNGRNGRNDPRNRPRPGVIPC